MRWRAAMSPGQLRDPRAAPLLTDLCKTETDGDVIEHIGKALAAFPTASPATP